MTPSRLFRILRLRVRSLSSQEQLDAELRREVSFHFDQLVHEFSTGGMAPRDARSAT